MLPDALRDRPLPAVSVDSYACRRCGAVLFRADEIVLRRPLWDLGEEKSEVFVLKSAAGLSRLRRYDASLHEGWYCCRFAMMRMLVDKFGTGDALLAYTSDVMRVPAGERPKPEGGGAPGQTELRATDFAAVIERDHGDVLDVVKLGATWCPPCRLVDRAIARIDAEGSLPDVRFFAIDVDGEPELAARFEVRSLPTLALYYRGRALDVRGAGVETAGGKLVGGLPQRALERLARSALEAARAGRSIVDLG